MPPSVRIAIDERTGVSEARRAAQRIATTAGFEPHQTSQLEIVVTEAGSNVVKHAGRGEILLRTYRASTGTQPHAPQTSGVEVLALDRGPGIADYAAARVDGWSSVSTLGLGLGSIQRLSTESDVYSRARAGLALYARVSSQAPPSSSRRAFAELGGVSVATADETACGDAWANEANERRLRVLVVDGLGHGHAAEHAATLALEVHARSAALPTTAVMQAIHEALRASRGAAASLAEIDFDQGVLRYCGVGNVSALVYDSVRVRHCVSHHGTLGHGTVRTQQFEYPWSAHALLVMHTDGLSSRWNLDDYPGIAAKHPALVAGVLYRDHARGNDDVTVVAARGRRA